MKNSVKRTLGDTVSSAAVWAMMTEASVTPKPGLVDRNNPGSHGDMDFFTLIHSATALLPWFRDCALAGFNSVDDPAVLFESLRPPGMTAEDVMKKSTGGINTHKGYIFSLGILSAAYGRLYRITRKPALDGVIQFAKEMTVNLRDDFSRSHKKNEITHGEAVFAHTNIQGIRGEVSLGFPSVIECALPLLRRLLQQGHSLNDAGVAVLLRLMARVQDTNLIHRGGIEAFRSIQKDLLDFLCIEPDMQAVMEKAEAMDREFILKKLSPGGCADLLGITFFLWKIFDDRSLTEHR